MRHAMFAIFALVAAAHSVNAQPSQPPLTSLNLDHFNCYISPGDPHPQLAILKDQFDTQANGLEFMQDLRLALFCNPVQKTYNGAVTKILHPADHLAMYLIPPEPMVPRAVTVQNQFGTQNLVTRRAIVLAVPSGKALISAVAAPQLPPTPPAADQLDHFKCYGASGPSINATVALQDQFQTYRTILMEPILFCNPVQKTVVTLTPGITAAGTVGTPTPALTTTTVSQPFAHLTCYTEVPRPFQTVVIYNNQFVAPGTLPTTAIGNAEILCAPSLKLSWSVITLNPTTGTTVLTPGN